MESTLCALAALSDPDLLAALGRVVVADRRVTAELLAHLAEVDRRRLYAREGCSSMFVYATERLGLSADAAQKRIQVARASRRFPQLLACLASGRVHLSGLNLLAPHLTDDNVEEVLARAAGKSKREIEVLVAELAPRPDVSACVRKLPGPRREPSRTAAAASKGSDTAARSDAGACSEAPQVAPALVGDLFSPPEPPPAPVSTPPRPPSPPSITPLAPARYKVQFTAGQDLHDKIERARDLLAHRVPSRDLAEVFERALELAIARLERERFALTHKPRAKPRATCPESRHIPADVQRQVYQRDGGQCTYVDGHGHRCSARGMLEFDHVIPHSLGGPSTFENVRLRCATHNRLEAEEKFGAGFMAQKRLFG